MMEGKEARGPGSWQAADMPRRDAHLVGLGLGPVLLGKSGDKS